jgi:hypothetical protein
MQQVKNFVQLTKEWWLNVRIREIWLKSIKDHISLIEPLRNLLLRQELDLNVFNPYKWPRLHDDRLKTFSLKEPTTMEKCLGFGL